MKELSQYQNVFRVAKRDSAANGSGPSKTKRNRPSVSCSSCKKRKLKCDRQVPCVLCSKRGDASSCHYSNVENFEHDKGDHGSRDFEVQLRLRRLEKMITNFMKTNEEGSEGLRNHSPRNNVSCDNDFDGGSIYSPSQTPKSFSETHQELKGPEKEYVNATHWTTILENIRDIQDAFDHEPKDSENISLLEPSSDVDIVLGSAGSLTLVDFCTSLPPRTTVDKFLSVYFNTMHSQTPILHTGKYLREYESFWTEPSTVSFLWISMLFSILYIASRNEQFHSHETLGLSQSLQRATYLERAAQALVTGRYMQAKPYAVESVLLYGVCKYLQKNEQDTDAWMIIGISTRLAMKMDYHRDPSHLPNISPFEGEMRRRTFFILEAFDLLLSFQAGLPAMIHEAECDTQPPGNLFDTDFDEDCKVLPPSRPPTDSTPMLYYRYKSQLARIFRRIYRHTISFMTSSYAETMKLDAELNRAHEDVPPSLRLKPLALSFTDQPYTILNRLYADLVILKSICILHREYLSRNRSDPSFDYSRRVCGDAALQILKHQMELHGACQPGGLLHEHRWMLSSLSCHDFLLAAMITSLDLYESHKQSATSSPEEIKTRATKYDTLRHCHGIWMSRRGFSRDARRASSVLAIMLAKVPRPTTPAESTREISSTAHASMDRNEPYPEPVVYSNSSSDDVRELDPVEQELPIDRYDPADFIAPDYLNTAFSEFDNIDWGLIDQSLVGLSSDCDVAVD